VRGPVVAPIGGNPESAVAGLRGDLAGSAQIAMRHMNIAAPLDHSQSRLPDQSNNLPKAQLAKGDRNQTGNEGDRWRFHDFT